NSFNSTHTLKETPRYQRMQVKNPPKANQNKKLSKRAKITKNSSVNGLREKLPDRVTVNRLKNQTNQRNGRESTKTLALICGLCEYNCGAEPTIHIKLAR